MNDDRYVAAIEICSSKIIAAVGKMCSDGRLDIIATDQERGVESVRYGIIQNLEETSMRISRVLDRLQRKPAISPRIITGLHVGLSGRSLRSIRTEVALNLPDDTEITDDILKKVKDEALSTSIDSSLEIIDAIPRIYYVNKGEMQSPKGAIGNKIEAVYDLIVCRPELRRNLMRTLDDKLGIDINSFEVTTLSTAQVVLSSEEKRLGCMLVDMGAETTTVSIYKDGSLRYYATLPLGGRNITRDITSLSVLEERAEEIKITTGNAIPSETTSNLNLNGLKMSDVSDLVVARSEEIVANIVEQMKYAEIKDSELPAGIICVGGGAKLSGIMDLLSRQTGLRVNYGKLPNFVHLEETKSPTTELLQVASILYTGAKNSDKVCLETPGRQELPITGEYDDEPIEEEITQKQKEPQQNPGNGLFNKIASRISNIFSNPEDDSDLIE